MGQFGDRNKKKKEVQQIDDEHMDLGDVKPMQFPNESPHLTFSAVHLPIGTDTTDAKVVFSAFLTWVYDNWRGIESFLEAGKLFPWDSCLA